MQNFELRHPVFCSFFLLISLMEYASFLLYMEEVRMNTMLLTIKLYELANSLGLTLIGFEMFYDLCVPFCKHRSSSTICKNAFTIKELNLLIPI